MKKDKCGEKIIKLRVTRFGDEPRFEDLPVDSCISELVEVLNKFGIRTIGHSCCGHGKKEGYICIDLYNLKISEGRAYLVIERHK